ncbi:MAG: hypothetical protein FWE51_01550 [Coriobacteriia bacterium]|nr:hypothetical protein [Coriobacteriia bacterium]
MTKVAFTDKITGRIVCAGSEVELEESRAKEVAGALGEDNLVALDVAEELQNHSAESSAESERKQAVKPQKRLARKK